MSTALLEVEALGAGYGGSRVLFGVSLAVGEGEVLTLMGRNGMGKTTTVRAVMGLVVPTAGRVVVAGRDMAGRPPHAIAKLGLGLVPEGRQIFPRLSVEENLVATAADRSGGGRWTLAAVYRLFPRLAERRRHGGDRLSGGEQQMLAIGRALMTNPRLLLLDEATEGLAPVIKQEIWAAIEDIRREGLGILLIDKSIEATSRLADRIAVIEKGEIVWSGTAPAFAAARDSLAGHLAL